MGGMALTCVCVRAHNLSPFSPEDVAWKRAISCSLEHSSDGAMEVKGHSEGKAGGGPLGEESHSGGFIRVVMSPAVP